MLCELSKLIHGKALIVVIDSSLSLLHCTVSSQTMDCPALQRLRKSPSRVRELEIMYHRQTSFGLSRVQSLGQCRIPRGCMHVTWQGIFQEQQQLDINQAGQTKGDFSLSHN